jgi:hypothetical protein
MKLRKRYMIPWLYSSIFMFGLSYVWHGLILNDLSEVSYPLPLFFFLAAIVYSFMGLVMTLTIIKTEISTKKWLNGVIIGSVVGFFLYLIAFVVGVSFSSNAALEHVILDITWQMIEQSFGGLLIGYLYHTYKEIRKAEAFQ